MSGVQLRGLGGVSERGAAARSRSPPSATSNHNHAPTRARPPPTFELEKGPHSLLEAAIVCCVRLVHSVV